MRLAVLLATVLFEWSRFVDAISPQKTLEYWSSDAQIQLDRRHSQLNFGPRPKNLVFFLGDGMGIAAVTAARIHKGQLEKRENNQAPLCFEQFASAGLVKTYSLDQHVTDSSAGAMAFLWGGKVNAMTVGVNGQVEFEDCKAVMGNEIRNAIPELALAKGMSVGFVTTTRITHATPAAMYAKTATRFSESDRDLRQNFLDRDLRQNLNGSTIGCRDIASQLLEYPARDFKVIMGGGRNKLTPASMGGEREDEVNILEQWRQLPGGKRTVLNSRTELFEMNFDIEQQVMGVFSNDGFDYDIDKKRNGNQHQPSLTEMTEKAIEILEKNNVNGYVLLVEGGLIDKALHENKAHIAIDELLQLELAIDLARKMTNSNETLFIVTADHSHTLTLPGYSKRNESIFGWWQPSVKHSVDGLPIPQLLFGTGPGGVTHSNATHVYRRQNLSQINTEDAHFVSPAAIPTLGGLHGGEDVGLWADGPYASLLTGTMENTYVAHVIKFLFCLEEGEGNGKCPAIPSTENNLYQLNFQPNTLAWLSLIAAIASSGSLFLLVILAWIKFSNLRRGNFDGDLERSLKFGLLQSGPPDSSTSLISRSS